MATSSEVLIPGLDSPTQTKIGQGEVMPAKSCRATESGRAKSSRASSQAPDQSNTKGKANIEGGALEDVVGASKRTGVITDEDEVNQLDQIRKLKHENSKLKKRVTKAEARIRANLETNDDLKSAFEACQLERSNVEEDFRQLQEQMVSTEKENGELKSRLLKLQPTDVVSDAQINDTYQTLCADIVDWVDTYLGDVDDLADCLKSGLQYEGYEALIMEFVDDGMWSTLQAHKAAASCFLQCVVQRFIMSRILTRYSSCVPAELTKSMRMIERQMQRSDTDPGKISNWRADGLRALHETAAIQQARDQKLADLTSDAAVLLSPLLSQPDDNTKAMQDFREQIIDAAFKLNQQIRTSSVEYALDGIYVLGTQTRPSPLQKRHTENNVLIDAVNGTKIRCLDSLLYDESGSFGQALCVVFPGLSRPGSCGQSIRICKATTLAMLNVEQQSTGLTALWLNYLSR